MEERWKLPDDEMFCGIPKNGTCALPRKGDLRDTVNYTVDRYIENYNSSVKHWNEYRLEYGRDLPSDAWRHMPISTREIPKDMVRRIDNDIERELDCAEGPFYIGRLPEAKRIQVASTSENKPIYLNYFADDTSIPYLKTAKEEVSTLREHMRTPLSELKQIVLRLLLAAFAVVQLLLAINENPGYEGFLMIPELPLLYPRVASGFLFWHGLGWFALGLLVAWASFALEFHYREPLGLLGSLLSFGHIILAAAHGICAMRIVFLSATVSALMLVATLVFVGMYLWAVLKLLPRMFRRFRRKKHIPANYKPNFIPNAAACYRYCRLRILWYENATGKKAPGRFRRAIRKLGRLDRAYRPLKRTLDKLTNQK